MQEQQTVHALLTEKPLGRTPRKLLFASFCIPVEGLKRRLVYWDDQHKQNQRNEIYVARFQTVADPSTCKKKNDRKRYGNGKNCSDYV